MVVKACGAAGGYHWIGHRGYGGCMTCLVSVTSGATLYVYVGGGSHAAYGEGGFNGGGDGSPNYYGIIGGGGGVVGDGTSGPRAHALATRVEGKRRMRRRRGGVAQRI